MRLKVTSTSRWASAGLACLALGLFAEPPRLVAIVKPAPAPPLPVEVGPPMLLNPFADPAQFFPAQRPQPVAPFFKDRIKSGILPNGSGDEYYLRTELKDGVYHVTEKHRKVEGEIRGHADSPGYELVPAGEKPMWRSDYRCPGELGVVVAGSPLLKYELGGKRYVRHFMGLSHSRGMGLNDVITVAEDLVKVRRCRNISLVYTKNSKEVTLVDDWGYFAVPPGYRPLDLKEFKRQLYEDKMNLRSHHAFPGILHESTMQSLREYYFEKPPDLVRVIPIRERRRYHGVERVAVPDLNHVIAKGALDSVFSCIEDQRHQLEYERLYGPENLKWALKARRILKSEKGD